jgi:hypothetical protein
MKPLGMKYITRYDYDGSLGWWVRIQRRLGKGEKPLVISQFFSDKHYGGKAPALKAAKIFRDGAAESAPPPKHQLHQPPGVSVGYGYVRRATITVKARDGSRQQKDIYEAWYKSLSGKVQKAKYSIEKWGEAEAKAKADAWYAGKSAPRSVRSAPRAPRAARSVSAA